MPNVSEIYAGKYLAAADLAGKEYTVTITQVDMQNLDDGERKLCVYLNNRPKGLLLNKTNAKSIAKMHGNNTDTWIGKQIVIFPAYVDFKGDQVEAVRVRPPRSASTGPGAFDDAPGMAEQAPIDIGLDKNFDDQGPPF